MKHWLLLFVGSVFFTQAPPFNLKEVEKKLKEVWEKLPTVQEEVKELGIRLQYKKLPWQGEKWVEEVAKKQGLPVTPQQIRLYARQLLPMVQKMMAPYFNKIGSWESQFPIDWRGKKLQAGKYHIGAFVNLRNRRLLYLFLWREKKKGKKKKREVFLLKPAKRWRKRTPLERLSIKIVRHPKKEKRFCLVVGYGFDLQRTSYGKVKK